MNYNQLNNLLKNHSEIHYITDSDIFFDDNNIDIIKFKTINLYYSNILLNLYLL